MARKNLPEDGDRILGEIIRRRRRETGMTQLELGQSAHVSYQQVQKYETGANRISFSMLIRMAKGLGCTVSDIVGEAENLLKSGQIG